MDVLLTGMKSGRVEDGLLETQEPWIGVGALDGKPLAGNPGPRVPGKRGEGSVKGRQTGGRRL
jgi:hypothetical protein